MDVDFGFTEKAVIGETIPVIVNSEIGSYNGLKKYSCSVSEEQLHDQKTFLTVPQEESVSVGDKVEGWVFDVNPSELVVTTDSFGKADFDNLKDRHMEAADHIARLVITGADKAEDVDLECVSHAKGLLSRCVRKDQWDWYTVFDLLGKPPEKQLNQGRQALSQLREAAKKGDNVDVAQYVDQLRRDGIGKRFAYFVRRVNLGNDYAAIDDEYLLKKLHRLDPLVFEKFVADLWAQLGWETEVVQVENDRGADVVAEKNDLFTRKRAIQVKRKNPESKHGLGEVQRYMGLTLRDGIDEALLVTTGQFTETAREEAAVSSYELIDGQELAEFIRSNDLGQVVTQYVEAPE